jgi:hypothetical protein
LHPKDLAQIIVSLRVGRVILDGTTEGGRSILQSPFFSQGHSPIAITLRPEQEQFLIRKLAGASELRCCAGFVP